MNSKMGISNGKMQRKGCKRSGLEEGGQSMKFHLEVILGTVKMAGSSSFMS